ncbi:Exu regulon transcriptional regulator [Micromonospora saelicesensis]|uniref:winged helix-turn-helix domain-containing protein n=1 Tax=Micromonospora saelicesensis TaxID=285676 RepID=UPI000DC015D2|nr:winged helix-turn-helix domain-containing protein [Micromonospora saelicesensis]RAO61793.1 Exu regulon transcriptional regulator [Micromonospora saelicesensis]
MSEAAYLQVARDIRQQVSSGQLKPGDKLPSFAALCEHCKVSNTVIRASMLLLKAEGWIDGRQGKGVYVANPLPR